MMHPDTTFTWLDWTVVALMLIVMVCVGWHYSRSNSSGKDFLLGGGKMDSGLVGLSLFATLFSTLSYLSYPGEMIKYGPVFLAGIFSFPIAGWVTGRFLIPKFRQLDISSAYQILEVKLGKKSRMLAVIYFLSLRFLWMATIIYATVSTALLPIFGLSEAATPWLCLLMAFVTVLYTTMGGMKAVVMTDAIHSLIMFAGAILAIAIALGKIGLSTFSDPSLYTHWIDWEWRPRMNVRMTAANIFMMNLTWQICTSGSDQMAIQRYLSVKDSRSAARSYHISLASSAMVQLLLAGVGLAVMGYFTVHPEQMAQGSTIYGDADSLFPIFIRVGLPSGVTGLIAAALMAAAMSSLSSGLNSSSAVIAEDILGETGRYRGGKVSVRTLRMISIILGLAVALTCTLIGKVPGNLLDVVIKVVNLVVAPLFVLFFMALFVPFSKDFPTMIAGILSLAWAIAVNFFNFPGISALWTMPTALAIGIAAGVTASLIESRIKDNKTMTI